VTSAAAVLPDARRYIDFCRPPVCRG